MINVQSMMCRTVIILSVLVLFSTEMQSSVLLSGDVRQGSTTFSFPVEAHATSMIGDNFYVGASSPVTDDAGKAYAFSYIQQGSTSFVPLAPEQVTLNGIASQKNPLYGQAISLVNVLSTPDAFSMADRPVVVSAAQPASVYLVQNFFNTPTLSMASLDSVGDADGQPTAGIVAMGVTATNPSAIFAAVKKHGGNFGDTGSGVAVINISEKTVDKVKTFVLEQYNSRTGLDAQPVATPFAANSSFLGITHPLASLTNVVDMYYDGILQSLFVVVQAQAQGGATDGARALAVGYVDSTARLIFKPIAPPTIFTQDSQNEIVGAIAAGAQVSLHKIRTMHTSTQLSYAIILGGNGDVASTKRTVYAVPLVNTKGANGVIADVAIQGTLASKNAPVQTFYAANEIPIFLRREVAVPATTPADIFTTQITGGGQPIPANYPAHVGFGPLAAGNIDEIIVAGDSVFAVVSTPADATQLPGIFYSQALFKADGTIQTWTQWKRVGGTAAAVFGSSYNPRQANFILMQGAHAAAVTNLVRTTWGFGNEDGLLSLARVMSAQFPVLQGGIQGLLDVPQNSPGLLAISALLATGLNKIVMTQTGGLNGSGAFVPKGGSGFVDSQQEFSEGALTADANAQTIAISGGLLNEIGPLVTATFARNGVSGNQGFLFVGGTNGVAVLTQANGQGWDATTGLGNNFVGLLNGMSFKRVGEYSFVRKLVHDGNFLYVLTDKVLDRVDLTQDGFPATTLATSYSLSGGSPKSALLDVIVSGKFALLSGNNVLVRVGNGADITTASSELDVQWTYVGIGQQVGPALRLIPLSYTGRLQDVARGPGGNIYVLNAYNVSAQVNRYAVTSVESGPITDQTLMPLPDILIRNIPDYYINFAGYASIFATDGSVQFHGNERDLALAPFVKTGSAKQFFKNIPLLLAQASTLVQITRNSASGSWLVAGDFGLQVNE